MNNKAMQLFCAWCGIATLVITGLGFWPAGFLPAGIEPGLTADQVAELYRSNTLGIRIAGLCAVGGAGFYFMFTAGIAAQLRRIETGSSPVMTYANMTVGTMVGFLFFIPGMFLTIAAFRPERAPEITQALNDVAFLFFLNPYIALFQDLAVGVAILSDKRKEPILPRWVGFLSLWVVVGFVPAAMCSFFKTGPFAWNGLFVWWIPIGIFVAWCVALSLCLVKAVKRQAAEEGWR